MLLFKFPCGPLQTNAILIGCQKTKKAVVIDPSSGSAEAILQVIKEQGLTVEKILLTHSHWDHFADAHTLAKSTNAPLFVHPLDAKNVENPGSDGIPLFFPIQSICPKGFLQEGEIVEVGQLKMEVIHSPGHSPGSVCFYLKEQKLLISGDTLFQGSIGNLNLPTADASMMWNSLQKLAKLPPETCVVPGHGGDTTIGRESWLSRAKEIFSE